MLPIPVRSLALGMFDRGVRSGKHECFVPVRVADQVWGMAVTASNLENFRSVLWLTDHSTMDVQTVTDVGSHASLLLDDLVIQFALGHTGVEEVRAGRRREYFLWQLSYFS